MRLPMRVRFDIMRQTHQRYQTATKKEKGVILDGFTQTAGYSRKYAAWILGHWGKTVTASFPEKL